MVAKMSGSLTTSCSVVLILVVWLTFSAACRCPYKTDEQKFCSSESVSLVRIKDHGTVIGSNRRYQVDLLYQYKVSSLGLATETEYVYTPKENSKCGVKLQNGAIYVISGHYALSASFQFRFLTSRMTTTSCDLQKMFEPPQPYVPPKC